MPDPVLVMVVDDHPSFRLAATAVAEIAPGFRLEAEAASGEAAIQLVARHRVDLVLIDVNMPGIDGLETAERVRRTLPDVVVVLVSTYEPNDLPEAVRSSALPYLSKQRLTPESLADLWQRHRPPGQER